MLGVQWNSAVDEFCFITSINFSPKRRKIRDGPNLTVDQIPHSIPIGLTKRMILSQVNGIYDPLGLATPFTIRAKIMMRRLFTEQKQLEWDDAIPEEYRDEWAQFFREMFNMEKIQFDRCVKPQAAVGGPSLVIFSDASEDAFGACAYTRWELQDGSFCSRLMAAKSRIAPARKITIVRLELNGAVLSKRLENTITQESRFEFEKIFYFVDSEIVKAMINKESYGFNTYAAVRIGEIQNGTSKDDWNWIEGQLNIADWTTRGKQPSDIGKGSTWQNGPKFLSQPVEQWPLKEASTDLELPEQVTVHVIEEQCITPSISNIIDIKRFSSYMKLIGVTARVLSVFRHTEKVSLRNLKLLPEQKLMLEAEDCWIRECQAGIKEKVNKGKFDSLSPELREDGVIIVGSRVKKWVDISYDNLDLPLLPGDHAFSKLYSAKIHNESHLGVSSIMAKVRLRFWVTKLRKILSSIRARCVTCKKGGKHLEKQIMGDLPDFRLKPSPPWYFTGIDYFGPFTIKGEVNKRSRGKCYGVLFVDLVSRAVHVDLAANYGTDEFLIVLRRFVSLRGFPKLFYSDEGSQLTAASKELKAAISELDVNQLKRFGHEKGVTWEFSTPDSPWQNGCTEILIKATKKAITGAIGEQILTFSEFQTVCYEAANLVNERPIGYVSNDVFDGSYLCPNQLILGRASSRVPSGPFDEPANNKQRLLVLQQIVDSFWRKWSRDYFPSLIIRKKWHTQKRNLQVGDVVIIQDSNTVRGEWKLGLVATVFPDEHGIVRNVEVKYKHLQEGRNYDGQPFVSVKRAVQKLVVILPVDYKAEEDMDDV